jgi:hypothetical protein
MDRDRTMVALSDPKAVPDSLDLGREIWPTHPEIEADLPHLGFGIRDQALFQPIFPAGFFLV